MSDDIKKQKEEVLRQLLLDQPDIGMKEANSVIRDQFDTGVSPVFSKVRKLLLEEQSEQKTKAAPKAKKPKKETKKPAVEDPTDSKADEAELSATEGKAEAPNAAEVEEKPKKRSRPKPNKNKKAKGEASSEANDEVSKDETPAAKSDDGEASIAVVEETEETPAPEPEPEIDPNLPRHTVKIEVSVDLEVQEVHLCGGFNLWKVGELPMKKEDDDIWSFEGELPEGEYTYKFVLDQKIWYLDPSRSRVIDKTGVSHAINIGNVEPKAEAS